MQATPQGSGYRAKDGRIYVPSNGWWCADCGIFEAVDDADRCSFCATVAALTAGELDRDEAAAAFHAHRLIGVREAAVR